MVQLLSGEQSRPMRVTAKLHTPKACLKRQTWRMKSSRRARMRGRCGSSCSKLHFLMWYGLMSTSEHMVQGTSNHGKGKTEHNPTHRVASAEGAWLVCGCVASRRQRPGLLQISLRHDFQWCSRPGGGKAILPSALSCKSSSDRCLSMYCGCLCVTPAST